MKKIVKYIIISSLLFITVGCNNTQTNVRKDEELFRPKACVPMENNTDLFISRCIVVQDST